MSGLRFDAVADDAHRRRLLWAMPAGIYVVGSVAQDRSAWNLMTHSLAMQASVTPCVVALAIEVSAGTHGFVEGSGVATLSVLRRDQRALVRRFVKPVEALDVDEEGRPTAMGGASVSLAPSGAPHLADAVGCLDLRVIERVRFGSHTLFCCEVTGVAVAEALLAGTPSERLAEVLRMEDTKMSYGG